MVIASLSASRSVALGAVFSGWNSPLAGFLGAGGRVADLEPTGRRSASLSIQRMGIGPIVPFCFEIGASADLSQVGFLPWAIWGVSAVGGVKTNATNLEGSVPSDITQPVLSQMGPWRIGRSVATRPGPINVPLFTMSSIE